MISLFKRLASGQFCSIGITLTFVNTLLVLCELYPNQLAVNELLELISPLSFIIAFLLAYFGPNGNVIGNISITIWHYEAIEDAPEFLKVVLILFFVDFVSTIITSIVPCGCVVKLISLQCW